MHKRMNSGKYRGVNIRIPLDPNKPVDYSGNNASDQGTRILNEIKNVFKKDPNAVREMARTLARVISRYSQEMNAKDTNEFLESSARAIVKHFELKPKIYETIHSEIKKHVSFMITSHVDETGKVYYLKQDIERKRIKIGDSLEKVFYGNEKYK